MKNILLLETIASDALKILHQQEQIHVVEAYDTNAATEAADQDVHAIITRGKGQVDKTLLDACPKLEAIARCGVGLDNIDVAAASARKVLVLNAPGANAATIAEHTLSRMLMLVRNMYQSVRHVKDADWQWRTRYSGDELGGKTLGVLGMGNIGRRVAHFAEAIGMKVIYWDMYTADVPYDRFSMEEVLRQSDVVTIHLPLTSDTEGLLDERALEILRPQTYLINTARGQIIDQVALRKVLQNERIAGFAADVLDKEPPHDHEPLLSMPNVLITPHSGSLTATTYRYMCVLSVNNVIAVLAGKEPKKGCIFNEKALA